LQIIFDEPPSIAELQLTPASVMQFDEPPAITLHAPTLEFAAPPPINEKLPHVILHIPPTTTE
jgi:hypothetical protein